MNREERRRLQRGAAARKSTPAGTPRRADSLKPGDVVTGTGPSGPYDGGPRTLAKQLQHVPEESKRTSAYRLIWTSGVSQIYYGDTVVYVLESG